MPGAEGAMHAEYAQQQILPYELILKQAKLLFMHSIEYDYAPISFQGIWTKNFIN
jgi:hypothetical protein